MGKYRRYNRYSDYYDDYNEEDPIAGLVLLGLFYIVYKYFTDRATFIHWLVYGILIVGVLLSGYIFIKIWKNKKAKKTFAEIKSVNADIDHMVIEAKKDNVIIEKVEKTNTPTPQAQALHDALIARGIKCELEKNDGHKHIDIAITWAKLNIEIDGIQHYTNPQQITSDYQRTYYSMKKGYKTLRYPNFVIEKYLDTVADAIAKLARGEYYRTHTNFR